MPASSAAAVANWLEWHTRQPSPLPSDAVATLTAALAGKQFLVGQSLTAADVVVGASLMAAPVSEDATIQAYIKVSISWMTLPFGLHTSRQSFL